MVAKMKQPDRTLFEVLDPFMTAHGFKFIKSRGSYFRKHSSGFDYFSWRSYPLETGEKWAAGYYEGHYGIGIRSDAIEELTREVMPLYGEDNQRYAFTVYRAVGRDGGYFAFNPSRDRELYLRFDHLEADVAETVGRIEAMLEADGWAWYARYAGPAALSQGVNNPIEGRLHPLVNNYEQRPLVGVAAACVAEPKRVPELIDQWLTTVEHNDEQHANQRAPMAPGLMGRLDRIVRKARQLGCDV